MMLVTLVLLAILTIGAVSASDNLTVEDGLTASDTEDNPIGEAPVDEVIAEAPEEPIGVVANDFNVWISNETLDADDDKNEVVISFLSPDGVDGEIDVFIDGRYKTYFMLDSSTQGSTINVTLENLYISQYGVQPVSLKYCPTSGDPYEIATGTFTVVKNYSKDEFDTTTYDDVRSETYRLYSFSKVPALGNLVVYVNGKECYNEYIDSKNPYMQLFVSDLDITENGIYNIRTEYVVEGSDQIIALDDFNTEVLCMPVSIFLADLPIDVADDYLKSIGSVYDKNGIRGTITAYIDNNQVFTKQYTVSDDKYSVNIDDFTYYDGFSLGNHTVKIVYSKNKEYVKEGNITFYADPTIINNGYGMTVGDNRFITVNYYKGSTGTLVVYNTVKDSTVSTGWKKSDVFMTIALNGNGTASIPLNTMSVGYHGFCLNITLGTYSVEKYVDINVNEKQDTRPSPDLLITVDDIKFGNDATVSITADSAFSGNVVVVVGDKSINVAVKNGAGSGKISNLDAGDYMASATFTANDTSAFKSGYASRYFTVEKIYPKNFRVDDYEYDLGYGDTLNLNVTTSEGITGFIAKLDGENATVAGNVILISNLSMGTHELFITSITDANYKSEELLVTIRVSKAQSKIIVDDEFAMIKGSFTNITVSTEGATGFTAKIDGIAAAVSGNVVEIPDSLDVGTHTVTITTIPDENHTVATKDIALTVKKLPSAVSINGDLAFDYGSSASCEVAYANATGVKAEVVGHSEASVVVDNKIITVSGLNAGKYTLMVTTIVDDNYEPATATANITVNKIKTSVSIRDSNIVFDYGSSNFTYVTSDVKFAAKVVGQSKAKVEIDGNKITVSGLDAGSYVLEVTTDDENYETAMATANITVNQIATKVTPSSTKVTTTYGTSKNIVVTLNDINGNPIEGKTIILTLNGKQYPKTTNGKGQATIAIPNNLAVKNAYSATITFAGDVNYAKSTGKVSVVVNKATPKLVYKAASFKRTLKTKQYTVTLKTDKNAIYKNAKVSLTVNKKTFSGKTNSKGQVTFKITNLSKNGKYTATIKFAGDAKYKAVSKSVKLTVK